VKTLRATDNFIDRNVDYKDAITTTISNVIKDIKNTDR
jgi:hypothetical protein